MTDPAVPAASLPADFVLEDPLIAASRTESVAGLTLRFPLIEADRLDDLLPALRARSREVFAALPAAEIQAAMARLDAHFADLSRPDVRAVVDLVRRVDGFSRHDIERFGLGIFPPLVAYDPALVGRFIERALRTRRPVETAFGHLQRFGLNRPFTRRREPGLISHFASGNVAGYSAVLTRIGLPVGPASGGGAWDRGAAQVLKLPSTAAVFPMIYLAKMAEIAPLVRSTIACGYWKGGDATVEDRLLAASSAVNVLGSDATVSDVEGRARRLARGPVVLGHGHKVGVAYVSREFATSPELQEKVLEGLASDISAFDGAACYSVKNVYVQGDHRAFAAELAEALDRHAKLASPVNPVLRPVGLRLARIYAGSADVVPTPDGSAFVRIKDRPSFWLPDETYRYVQVMPAENAGSVAALLYGSRRLLQTVVVAVPDAAIVPALRLFGQAGASNVHFPGSAPLFNPHEEPHDGDFDFVKVRYPYRVRFAATNFKRNADWLR